MFYKTSNKTQLALRIYLAAVIFKKCQLLHFWKLRNTQYPQQQVFKVELVYENKRSVQNVIFKKSSLQMKHILKLVSP